jgi:hypothetical protein
MSPGGTADRGHHRVGGPVWRPGPQGRVIAGRSRSALQCCNRSRHPAGQQPLPLPGGARSDPGGVLLDHGHAPGRDGRQGSSPGGRPGLAAWPSGAGDRGQERAAVLQPLEAPRWPAAPASPWWCEIRSGGRAAGPWPCPRVGRQTGAITGWATRSGGLASGEGDRGEEQAAVLQPLDAPRWSAHLTSRGGARSDPVGVLLGQVPGLDGKQGHHLVCGRSSVLAPRGG